MASQERDRLIDFLGGPPQPLVQRFLGPGFLRPHGEIDRGQRRGEQDRLGDRAGQPAAPPIHSRPDQGVTHRLGRLAALELVDRRRTPTDKFG